MNQHYHKLATNNEMILPAIKDELSVEASYFKQVHLVDASLSPSFVN